MEREGVLVKDATGLRNGLLHTEAEVTEMRTFSLKQRRARCLVLVASGHLLNDGPRPRAVFCVRAIIPLDGKQNME